MDKIKPVYLSYDALQYVQEYRLTHIKEWCMMIESLSSCAIEGNQMAEELLTTINRIEKGEGVGDRWVLQLAYYLLKEDCHGQD